MIYIISFDRTRTWDNFLLKWVRNGQVEFEKNIAYYKAIYSLHIDNFVSRDVKEQMEEFVRLLLYTTKNWSREDKVSKQRAK
jgi:hypothetical protein